MPKLEPDKDQEWTYLHSNNGMHLRIQVRNRLKHLDVHLLDNSTKHKKLLQNHNCFLHPYLQSLLLERNSNVL